MLLAEIIVQLIIKHFYYCHQENILFSWNTVLLLVQLHYLIIHHKNMCRITIVDFEQFVVSWANDPFAYKRIYYRLVAPVVQKHTLRPTFPTLSQVPPPIMHLVLMSTSPLSILRFPQWPCPQSCRGLRQCTASLPERRILPRVSDSWS